MTASVDDRFPTVRRILVRSSSVMWILLGTLNR